MQDIRRVLCWIFASTSVVFPLLSLRSIYAIGQRYAFLSPRYLLVNLLIEVLFRVIVATITGVAWWTILKGKPSARFWGITASLMYILVFLLPMIFVPRSVWWHHVGALFVGIVGLVEFFRRPSKDPEESVEYGSGVLRL